MNSNFLSTSFLPLLPRSYFLCHPYEDCNTIMSKLEEEKEDKTVKKLSYALV